MKKILLYQLAYIMLVLLFCFQCYAQDISSPEMIKDAKLYDGKSVTYQGEVVGDIMIRGGFAWLNINDGPNAIGIWINKKLIKDILYTGSYRAKGDLVKITGKFNRSCVEHGGDLDIHAQSITKISSGSKIYHIINTRAVNFAFVLFCIILLVFLLKIRQSRKSTSLRFF